MWYKSRRQKIQCGNLQQEVVQNDSPLCQRKWVHHFCKNRLPLQIINNLVTSKCQYNLPYVAQCFPKVICVFNCSNRAKKFILMKDSYEEAKLKKWGCFQKKSKKWFIFTGKENRRENFQLLLETYCNFTKKNFYRKKRNLVKVTV